jgi:N-succinyldiaminopimelate aminotransferase
VVTHRHIVNYYCLPMGRNAHRLDGIGSTIFAEMSALAVRTGSVNLGQGFPDEDGPDALIEAAVDALRGGRNQYPPGHGTPELLDAVVAHQARFYGLELDRSQVVATTGATEAIAGALLGLVDPGDEVVVLEPYYDSYVAMIQIAGGIRKPVTLRAPEFRLDLDELAAAITDRTRAILLNTPHNPTGTVLTRAELEGVAALAVEHDLIVISDEVYEHLVFGVEHVPIATLPGMFERTVTISSAGKTFSVTGWKIGWASGPTDLVAAVESAKNWLTYVSGGPLQPAVARALNEQDGFHRQLAADLARKRDLLCDGLADLGLTVYRPEGTYFATTDVSGAGYADGRAFCLALPERAGVVAIPAQVFYDDQDEGRHLVRWAFCKKESVIAEGLDRLRGAGL